MSKYYAPPYYSALLNPELHFRHPIERWAKRKQVLYATTSKGIIGKLLYRRWPESGLKSLAHISPNRSARILDVGCGSGYRLYQLANAGYKHLQGIDPFLDFSIQYRNGLRILKQTIHDTGPEWDILTFHHSFEHIADQLAALETARKLLAPGGWCLIRIPTCSSWAWKHYRENWVQADAPRHFFLHSVGSISMLAQEAGFSVEHVSYDSFSIQFWGSEQYKANIALNEERSWFKDRTKSLFSEKDIERFELRANELNDCRDGDQICLYLRPQ